MTFIRMKDGSEIALSDITDLREASAVLDHVEASIVTIKTQLDLDKLEPSHEADWRIRAEGALRHHTYARKRLLGLIRQLEFDRKSRWFNSPKRGDELRNALKPFLMKEINFKGSPYEPVSMTVTVGDVQKARAAYWNAPPKASDWDDPAGSDTRPLVEQITIAARAMLDATDAFDGSAEADDRCHAAVEALRAALQQTVVPQPFCDRNHRAA